MITEKLTTIARPYAIAAFEYALANHDLASWEMMLQTAAAIAQDKKVSGLFDNPQITQKQLADLFCDVLKKMLDAEKKNFIQLLAEYHRLVALPEIAELFVKQREHYEKKITVELTSAIVLDPSRQQKFIDALTRRFKRKVTLECKVDPYLLGGAIIRAGDNVIDGSIRGKLNRLIESI